MIDAEELYDYQKDPLEKKSLIDNPEYTEVKKMMIAKSKAFFTEQQK